MACDLASILLALKLVTPYLEETHEFDRSGSGQVGTGQGWVSGGSGTAPTISSGTMGRIYSTKKDLTDRLKEEIKYNQERLVQLEKEKAAEVLRNANIKKAKDLARQCK